MKIIISFFVQIVFLVFNAFLGMKKKRNEKVHSFILCERYC